MKHYKDFLVHGAQLFRHLKAQQASGSEKALEELPLAASRTAARALARKALGEDDGGSDFGLGFGGDNADMGAFMESFDQCGIDVDEMTNKALGAYFLYGSNVDLSSPETYPGIDAFGPIFLSLKDDDEMDCSDQEMAELTAAFEGYAQCSGISNFIDPEEIKSGVLSQSIQDACKPVFDMVTSGDMLSLEAGIDDENSDLYASGKECLRTLLGDNSIGNFIRYEYDHIDKILQCFTKLSEDLPHCVVSAPVEDGESISFPVSLDKKLACVIGSSSDSIIEDACIGIFEMYDECIPQDTNAEEEVVATSCGEDLLPFGMDLSVVTGDKLPSFCSDVFEEKGLDAKALTLRFNAYNEKRERGWTIDDYAEVEDPKDEIDKVENPKEEIETAVEPPDVEAVEDEASAAEDPKDEIETVAAPPKVDEGEVEPPVQPEDMYKSNPIDVASVESGNWEDGEAEPADTKAKSFPFLAAGIAILAAVTLALFVKYRSYGAATSTQRPRKDYSSVLILQVEEPIV